MSIIYLVNPSKLMYCALWKESSIICCLLVNSSLLFAFSDYESDYEDDYGCGYDSGYMHDCDYSDPIGLSYSDNVVGETNVCSAQSEKYWCD